MQWPTTLCSTCLTARTVCTTMSYGRTGVISTASSSSVLLSHPPTKTRLFVGCHLTHSLREGNSFESYALRSPQKTSDSSSDCILLLSGFVREQPAWNTEKHTGRFAPLLSSPHPSYPDDSLLSRKRLELPPGDPQSRDVV